MSSVAIDGGLIVCSVDFHVLFLTVELHECVNLMSNICVFKLLTSVIRHCTDQVKTVHGFNKLVCVCGC